MPDPYKSIHLIRHELEARGFTATKIVENGHSYFVFTKNDLRWQSRTAYVDYPFVPLAIKNLSTRKDQAYAYVANHGVAIAKTFSYTTPDEVAWDKVKAVTPLIVKPVDSDGSQGLTRNVTTEEALLTGVKNALLISTHALVQQQFFGDELRFTCMNGRVMSALLRMPATLKGDGEHTVEPLLSAATAARPQLNEHLPYIQYPQLQANLVLQNLRQDEIVAKDVTIQIGESTMISGGAYVYDVLTEVDPTYIDVIEGLVQSLDARFLVVDFLIADRTVPAKPDNYIFLEFNTAPALKLYYSIRDGEQFDIVPLLSDLIVEQLKGVSVTIAK